MRGDDVQQGAMFSYLSPEQRVPADHPLRPIRKMVDTVLKRLAGRFEGHVCRRRTALDCSREAAARFGLAVPLFGAQRADVDGTVGLQPPVPPVCGPEYGRSGLGLHGLLKTKVARAFFEEVG